MPPSEWNLFVKKTYEEGRAKHGSSYSFKDALKDASRRKQSSISSKHRNQTLHRNPRKHSTRSRTTDKNESIDFDTDHVVEVDISASPSASHAVSDSHNRRKKRISSSRSSCCPCEVDSAKSRRKSQIYDARDSSLSPTDRLYGGNKDRMRTRRRGRSRVAHRRRRVSFRVYR
jgi:hypothetical protein